MNYGANPYRSPLSATEAGFAASALEQDRVAFIRKTYVHLGGAILAFVTLQDLIFALVPAAALLQFTQTLSGGWLWLAFLGAFMVVSWVARSWAESTASRQIQYVGLGLYVVAEAILFVPLLSVAQFYVGDPYLIPSAALITLMSFGGLTAAVIFTRADFSFLRMYLFWGGIIALGLIVCAIAFGLSLGIWFSVAMIALAGGYILYDTSNILHHYRTDQYVAASLALFASVALLFWWVLRLLMSFSSRD
jgi:FtsH-binding integral membrane protein